MKAIQFTFLAFCLISLTTVSSLAQENVVVGKSELRDELKAFAPFIGTWEIDGEWMTGEKIWARSEYIVGMAGNFVEAKTWTRGEDGKVYQRYLTIWRWDAENKKVTSHGFTHDGTYTGMDTRATIDESKATLVSNWESGGTEIEQRVQIIDENSYSWKVWTVAGEDLNQLMDGVWKRTK